MGRAATRKRARRTLLAEPDHAPASSAHEVFMDGLIEIARLMGKYKRLADGVMGTLDVEPDGSWHIPLIVSDVPGQGNVSRYLDTLPRDRRIVFHGVHEPLLSALERRGFVSTFAERGEILERKATS